MRYEPAAKNPPAGGCQPGTRALAAAVRTVYPELQSLTSTYGCYNHRKMAGSSSWSLHAEGRACDIGVTSREVETGWNLACDLVAQRIVYGTMRVMWAGHIWSIEHASDWRPLKPSSNQHLDHLHVEQYWAAALRPLSVQWVYEEQLRAAR